MILLQRRVPLNYGSIKRGIQISGPVVLFYDHESKNLFSLTDTTAVLKVSLNTNTLLRMLPKLINKSI